MTGAPTVFALGPLAAAPSGRAPQVRGARRYLEATHASVTGILDSFGLVRAEAARARGTAAGRLSRDQVDLLRAAMVFTSSGLDATCHRLVQDAAPALIDRDGTAATLFDLYLKQQLELPKAPDGLLAAITAADPRGALVRRYVDAKTASSYQGSSDLRVRARDLLGIPKKALPDARFAALDGFFTARNQIVHRLDYEEPSGKRTARHHRAPAAVVEACEQVLVLATDLVDRTAALLRP